MNLLDDIILWEVGLCDEEGRVFPDRHPLALQIRTRAALKLADALRAVAGDGEAIAEPVPRILELVKFAADHCEPFEDSLEETLRAVRWAINLHRRLKAIPTARARDERVARECSEVACVLHELADAIRAYDESRIDSASPAAVS